MNIRIKRIIFVLIGVCFHMAVNAQELRCNVYVSSQKIQVTNREIFNNMQRDINEFMNTRRWTSNVFSVDERIECNIQITLDEQSGDQYKGTMQVRSSRPIFNSAYNTMLLNIKDNDVLFTYREFEPLEYNESGQNTSLVNLMAFYAYFIIGFDYDSYALMGGNEYFTKAENIVAQSQNARETGWKSFESRRNRYWLINNLQDRSYSAIREGSYKYHRLGLDKMSDDVNEGRKEVLSSLELFQKANRTKPNSYIIQVFFDSKSDELLNIFKPAFNDERKRVYNIVTEMNAANASKFAPLNETQK
ncbi:DUF4835 family protein [Odoribacter sp. OttesenSCG-928-J03]|nr:DUF4835 family protein [Odoribacter sp. OttesenSCG-928-J03]